MDYQQLLKSITPDIYASLKRAVELGKWPNGDRLTPAQRESCMQAVIAYDLQHKPQQQRVGYIHTSPHEHCGHSGEAEGCDDPKPLKWT